MTDVGLLCGRPRRVPVCRPGHALLHGGKPLRGRIRGARGPAVGRAYRGRPRRFAPRPFALNGLPVSDWIHGNVHQQGPRGLPIRFRDPARARDGGAWARGPRPAGRDGCSRRPRPRRPLSACGQRRSPTRSLKRRPPASGERVNELAKAIADLFTESIRGERVEAAWPCIFAGGQDVTGLGRASPRWRRPSSRYSGRRSGRIAKLASADRPRVGPVRGLFVWFTDFGHAQVSRTAFMNGQLRMADDDASPSRSYPQGGGVVRHPRRGTPGGGDGVRPWRGARGLELQRREAGRTGGRGRQRTAQGRRARQFP